MKKKILSGLGVLVVYGIGAFLYARGQEYDLPVVLALALAAGIGLFNYILGVFFNKKVFHAQAEMFTQVVMKNMLKRMALVLAIFFTIMLSIDLNHFVFVAAFFILYFLLQIIEIKDLQKYS